MGCYNTINVSVSVNGQNGEFEECAIVQWGNKRVMVNSRFLTGGGSDGKTMLCVVLPAADAVLYPYQFRNIALGDDF